MVAGYKKFTPISIKHSSTFDEKWLQDIIADDPQILGLGDLNLKERERNQPKAGRLDLLLEDDNNRRFEVEIQLGKSDESHIIRTIEYWDIERKRSPNYDHTAVIVAEDITSRFLNVISLFNGHIPIIALQVSAFESGGETGLIFTRVLDETRLLDDEEDDQEITDREYWLNKGSPETVAMAEKLLVEIQKFAEGHELNFTKHYIGLRKGHRSNNFVNFRPKKRWIHLLVKLPQTSETDAVIDELDVDYSYERWNQYRINIRPPDLDRKMEVITSLMKQAWEFRQG